jgi:hypothetical protein
MPLPTLQATPDAKLDKLNELDKPLAKHEPKDRSNLPVDRFLKPTGSRNTSVNLPNTLRLILVEPTVLNALIRSNRSTKPS